MKIRIFVLVLLALAACDTSSNVEPVYEKYFITYYGTEGDQEGIDMVANADGTMLLLGNSTLPTGVVSPFLIKVDSKGAVIWEANVGGDGEAAVDMELVNGGTYAGNFVIVTNTAGVSAISRIKLYIIDTNGNVVNEGVEIGMHPGGTRQVAKSITPLAQGGFVLTGYGDGALIRESTPSITPTTDIQDILAFSLDDQLAIVDTLVTKGGEQNGAGVKIFEMPVGSKGNYSIFGYSDRPYDESEFRFKYTYDFIIGGIPVGKVIGSNTEENFLNSAIETPNSPGAGYLMAGTSRTSDLAADVYLVKLNSTLEIKTFERKLDLGANMECVAADNAPSGFYVLANEIREGGLRNMTIVKTGMDGVEEWVHSFGSAEGDDSGGTIKLLPDGRIAIVGTMDLQTRKKLALIVLNSNGDL
jgi:hypothetical protein